MGENDPAAAAAEAAQAAAEARAALKRRPDDVDALNRLGIALWRQGELTEAERHYRRALAINPDDAGVLTNLGVVLAAQNRKDEAVIAYRAAVQRKGDLFATRMNLGIVLSDIGRFDEAGKWLQSALELAPSSAEVLQNVGMNLSRQARWAEAIEYYERATRLKPDDPELHRSFSSVLLGAGDYARGWPEQEWRLRCLPLRGPRVNRTFWNGDDFRNQTILLHFEQGYGDTLQFIRFAPMVKRRGGRVVLLVQAPLLRLLARTPGIDLVFDGTSYEPECHIHAPLISLPAIFATTLATLPAQVPYLFADAALVDHWRGELMRALEGQPEQAAWERGATGQHGRARPFLIGVAWQGNPEHEGDRWRSFPLARLLPLADRPGVRLISLQVGEGRDQVCSLGDRFPVIDLPTRRGRDFSETAAIMCLLDLVITPDTAVAHLAGGIGLRVWVAIPYSSDWRWLSGRDDSPWYPTMRLFRQTTLGEWDDVFHRISAALDNELRRNAAARDGAAA
jgi:Flp pilus assembly protein TadD